MTDIIGKDTLVAMYEESKVSIHNLYSFSKGKEVKGANYAEWIKEFDAKEGHADIKVALKTDNLNQQLLPHINLPKFYSDIAELENVQMFQGDEAFKDKPFYIKKEQFICVVHGLLHVAMVPHVNRQEVYAGGKWIKHSIYDENKYGFPLSDNEQMNVSPIDLFKEPKNYAKQFPHYKNAARNLIYVEKGDCLFMPAFYYY
jgi:hypothetical protein